MGDSNYGQSFKDKLSDLKYLISEYDPFYKNPNSLTLKNRERKWNDLIEKYVPSVMNEFPQVVEYLEIVLKDLDEKNKENIELKKQKKSAYSKMGWGHYDHFDSAVDQRMYFGLIMKKDIDFSELIRESANFGSKDQIGLFAVKNEHIEMLKSYYNDLGVDCASYFKPKFEINEKHEDLNWDNVALYTSDGVVYWDLEMFKVSELKGLRLKYIFMMAVDNFSDLYEYKRLLK